MEMSDSIVGPVHLELRGEFWTGSQQYADSVSSHETGRNHQGSDYD